MKLYHGTSEQVAIKAMKGGLLPRREAKKSNWKHTVHSHKDMVYLTDAYPLYFAMNAIPERRIKDTKHPGPNLRAAVIEIDTDLLDIGLLLPDEDVLEQAGRGHDDLPAEWDMKQRTRYYRGKMTNYGHGPWRTSLEAMGTCAHYGPIPSSAITRVALIDIVQQKDLCWSAMDASVCLANYKFCGHGYRAMTAAIFGDPLPEPESDIDRLMADRNLRGLHDLSRDGIEILVP